MCMYCIYVNNCEPYRLSETTLDLPVLHQISAMSRERDSRWMDLRTHALPAFPEHGVLGDKTCMSNGSSTSKFLTQTKECGKGVYETSLSIRLQRIGWRCKHLGRNNSKFSWECNILTIETDQVSRDKLPGRVHAAERGHDWHNWEPPYVLWTMRRNWPEKRLLSSERKKRLSHAENLQGRLSPRRAEYDAYRKQRQGHKHQKQTCRAAKGYAIGKDAITSSHGNKCVQREHRSCRTSRAAAGPAEPHWRRSRAHVSRPPRNTTS